MLLLYGSAALDYFADIDRTPYDLDFIYSDEDQIKAMAIKFGWMLSERPRGYHIDLRKSGLGNCAQIGNPAGMLNRTYNRIELKKALPGSSDFAYLIHCVNTGSYRTRNVTVDEENDVSITAAQPDVLYSIKRSHRHYPRNWEKHIKDYLILRQLVGGVDKLADITKLREQETAERLGKLTTPSLKKTAEEFFDDSVSNKYFVHDEMHSIMSHYDEPLFERLKVDPAKVTCSKDKFEALSLEDRMKCVLEEAYVIALERGIIPSMFGGKGYVNSAGALKWALMRICTTLCSGWFREFALNNYDKILQASNAQYAAKFLEAVDKGTIKLINAKQIQSISQ